MKGNYKKMLRRMAHGPTSTAAFGLRDVMWIRRHIGMGFVKFFEALRAHTLSESYGAKHPCPAGKTVRHPSDH